MAGSGGFGSRPSSSSSYSSSGSGSIWGPGGRPTSTSGSRTSSTSGGLGGTSSSGYSSAPQIPTFPQMPMPQWTPYTAPPPPMVSNVATPAFTSTAARDPQLQAMYDAWGAYRGQLAAGADQDAINAMMRQRDLASGLRSEMESSAAMRGLGPETGASQYLQARGMDQASRNMAGLNANLASDARRQQMAALAGQTGAAQAAAGDLSGQRAQDIARYQATTGAMQGQQQYGLSQWQAQQAAAQAAAQMQAMQNQNLWNQQMQMMNMMGNIYSGF